MRNDARRLAISRRSFLRGLGGAFFALSVPSLGTRTARAAGTDPVVVAIFLRGAADALSLVVPHGDAAYASLRPTIALSPNDTHDLDGFYALHPSLGALLPLYQDGSLAIVHAVGSPDPTRSHFEAQGFLETAAPGAPDVTTGWLNRWLASIHATAAFAGVSIGFAKAQSLIGSVQTVSMVSLDAFKPDDLLTGSRLGALQQIYDNWPDPRMSETADEMLEATALVATVSRTTSVTYPDSDFARALRDGAALIKAQVGVRALAVDLASFDLHTDANLGLPPLAASLGDALAAFHQDLGGDSARTLTLVMSEFGRTAAENGGGGTDHGHGGVMFAMGGGINGGRVLTKGGTWPGLAAANLYEGRDLAVTTDFRDVFAEVLRRHLGVANPSSLLNGYTTSPAQELGLWS